jgi:hypothetical protein
MAAKLKDIETSLLALFSGVTVTDINGGADLVVPYYVDTPDLEEQDRTFPSIGIRFADMIWQEDMEHTLPREDISIDNTVNPPQYVSIRPHHWYRLFYEIHSWSLYALHDRDLVRRIENRISPRDGITVGSDTYWIFREGFGSEDMVDYDRRIYHKVWTYSVLADIDNQDTALVEYGVEEVELESYSVKNRPFDGQLRPINEQNQPTTAQSAVRTLHRTFRFDDSDFWFTSN